jgi:hypothetical protein
MVFQYQTDEPVDGYVNVSLSFVFVVPGGVQPFVDLRSLLGNRQFRNSYLAMLGVGKEL